MKTIKIFGLVVCTFIFFTSFAVKADTVEDLLKSANDNYKAKKYAKALEDIEWAKREISNLHLELVKAMLPENLPGYETQEIDGDNMFGMHNVSRNYVKDDKSIKISIAGSQGNQGGSGLGAIFGMAAAFQSMDANTKSKMVVVQGRKGQFNLDPSNGTGTLTFTLNNNVFVSIETHGFTDEVEAKKASELLKFDEIEKIYM